MAPPPRTHCVLGHLIAGENLYVTPAGLHKCRACRTLATRRSEGKRRAKLRATETDEEREVRLAALKRSPEDVARYNANRRKVAAAKRAEREKERRAAERSAKRFAPQIDRALAAYPGILKFDAHDWLADDDCFAKLAQDMIKIGTSPKRLGPRPQPTPEEARAEFEHWVEARRAARAAPEPEPEPVVDEPEEDEPPPPSPPVERRPPRPKRNTMPVRRPQPQPGEVPACESCARIGHWSPRDYRRAEKPTTVRDLLPEPMWLCEWCAKRTGEWGSLPTEDEVRLRSAGYRVTRIPGR